MCSSLDFIFSSPFLFVVLDDLGGDLDLSSLVFSFEFLCLDLESSLLYPL